MPSDWQRVKTHDLVIPVPPGWHKTLDTTGKSDRPDPDPPQILYLEDPSAERWPGARFVSIWIWPTRSLDDLVRTRFVEGNLSFVSQGTVASWRAIRETIGVAQWSDTRGSGSYLARNLFVQVDSERVVLVGVVGPQVASKRTEPTAEMRAIQEIIAFNVEALPASGCPRTRSVDAAGVITANGAIGILDSTYASISEDPAFMRSDVFVMLKRGAVVGDRISVEFQQIGSTAPATWVAYGVGAEPRKTSPVVRPDGWGDVLFKLGVKPIGFANSCWRLVVDGADTGIVLFVGP